MKVQLGSILSEVNEKTTKNNQYPVLTSSKSGLYLQSNYFNKQVASKDNTGYKIIKRNQFTYRAMSDTGKFFPNMLDCADVGIVSPAYPVFEISDKSVIIPEYLKYFFKSNSFQHSIASFAQGSTRTSVKFNKMKTVIINIPSIETQMETIEIIKKVSTIITHRRTQLEKLDLLVKARFVEMFGNPVINPYGWEMRRLQDVCKKLTDGTHFSPKSFSSGDYKYITAKNIKIDGFDFTGLSYVPEAVHRSIYERCNPEYGDILYIKDGATTGIAMINTLHEEFTMLSSIALIKYDRSLLNGIFLKTLMNSQPFYAAMRNNMGGAAITRLTVKKLCDTIVPVPPLALQTQFADFVKQVDKSKATVQKALDEAQLLFDSLMQEYFG